MSCGCASQPCICGCCDGIAVITPVSEFNPPGQSALTYRAGTYSAFFTTMLARLVNLAIDVPSEKGTGIDTLYPLRALTVRDTSDPSIALLDGWSVLADVLTFYQERIANEGYLKTALERRSILDLGRLVGYRARPGVASSVYLAFTATQDFIGDIPAGTRAQSIPDPGELPQFFETSDVLSVRASWNAMKPRLTRPQVISRVRDDQGAPPAVTDVDVIDTIYFDGVSTNLKTGAVLLFIFNSLSGGQWMRRVETVTAQPDDKRTEVVLTETFENVSEVEQLQLYIDKAQYLFEGSTLASDVANILTTFQANPDPDQVPLVIARLREKLNLANQRGFTRTAAWISHIAELLPNIAPMLATEFFRSHGDSTKFTYTPDLAKSSLAASPLANLVGMAGSLARAPSLQPANALRLGRTVAKSFGPQSDIAPRLLANFHPTAAPSLYGAWKSVAKPYGWVEVQAARVATGLFASRFPGPPTIPTGGGGTPTYTHQPTISTAWPSLLRFNDGVLDATVPPSAVALDSTYDEIKPGSWVAIERPLLTAVDTPSGRFVSYHQVQSVRSVSMDTQTGYSAKATLLILNPQWLTIRAQNEQLAWLLKSNDVLRETVVFAQGEALTLAQEPLDLEVAGDTLSLDDVYDGLEPGRWVTVSGNRTDVGSASGVSASELAMIGSVAQGSEPPYGAASPDFVPFTSVLYTSPANAAGDRVVVGAITPDMLKQIQSLTDPLVLNQQYREQIELAPGFFANAYVPTAAERGGSFTDFAGILVYPTGAPVPGGVIPSTIVPTFFAWRISTPKLHTILNFAAPLAYVYDSASAAVAGNVVKATQGQTVGEVLGDGNGAQAFQTFDLHQSPVTYVSAPTADGAQSTLVVRVNDIEWREQDTLAFAGPRDRVFVTAADDDDVMTVTFGNGARGARVPTGTANVKATYRYGIGASGNVAARKISQLATQPRGAQSVVNPLLASGGADRDSADEARQNTPIAVAALDRLVSVKDYAGFSRAYAGIGKASSTGLSDGRRQLVHVTIAGARNIPIDVNSDLYRNLLISLQSNGDPSLPVELATCRQRVMVMEAGVQLLADYEWEAVEPVIRAALLDAFGFAARNLGQSAFLSEAVRVAQEVEGVSYVNFSKFDSVAEDATAETLASLANTLTLYPFIRAELARPDTTGAILPAELVVLTPAISDTLILTNLGS